MKPGRHFVYFDPIAALAPDAQARWHNPRIAEDMIDEAVHRAGGSRNYVPA